MRLLHAARATRWYYRNRFEQHERYRDRDNDDAARKKIVYE